MEALLWPGRILALFGLLLAAAGIWALAPLLRQVTSGFVLRSSGRLRNGACVAVDGLRGRVVDLGWLQSTLQTETGDLVLLPNSYLVNRPLEVARDGQEFPPHRAAAAAHAPTPAHASPGAGEARADDDAPLDPQTWRRCGPLTLPPATRRSGV